MAGVSNASCVDCRGAYERKNTDSLVVSVGLIGCFTLASTVLASSLLVPTSK